MKVYIVTIGSYSDYSIDSVFSTVELAETYRSKLEVSGADCPQILEMELDELENISAVVKTVYHCCISLRDGEIWDGCAKQPSDELWRVESKEIVKCTNQRSDTIYVREQTYGYGIPKIEVSSFVSLEHARKLAVEARQKWIREKHNA